MLQQLVENVWVEQRQLRFFGVETGTRMTVVRLGNGSLFIHSPVPLDPFLKEKVESLGEVVAIVAPSLFHHLSVTQWAHHYPKAKLYCCPGLEKKRGDVRWAAVLGDTPLPLWRNEIDQVHFSTRSIENEVIFFHQPSKTYICADAIFNLTNHPSKLTRVVARLLGNNEPGATYLEHLMMTNRSLARQQVGKMVGWGPDRIILAHGDLITENARTVIEHAYSWL